MDTKNLSAKLTIKYDGKDVEQGTARAKADLKDLSQLEEQYQQKLRNRVRSIDEGHRMAWDLQQMGYGGGGNAARGGAGGGGLGGLAGLGSAARASGALAALAGAFRFAHFGQELYKTTDNPFLSGDERSRAITRSVMGGETVQGWNDALTQRNRRMLLSEFEGRQTEARAGIRAAESQAIFGFQGQQTEARARAAGLRGAELAAFNPGDRAGVRGEKIYQEELQLVGLREKALKANRESAIARKAEEESASRLAGYDRQTAEYNRQKIELFNKFTAAEGPEKALLAGRLGAADVSLTNANQLARQEAQRLIEARQRVATSERAATEAGLDVRRGQLSILEGREQTAAEQAVRLSSLGPGGRMKGRFALEFLQQQGIELAPPELIQSAQSYAPDTVRKMLEASGGKFIHEARQVAPEEYRDDLSDIRRQVDTARQAIRADELQAMKVEAEKARDAVNDLTAILRTFAVELAQVRRDVEIQLRKGNGAQ